MLIEKRKYPWVGEQTWEDILFLHWKIRPESIRPFVPASLEIDTFDGDAWVSAVTFQAKNSIVRGMPKRTSFPALTQINLRTYVGHPEKYERGVYFFSIRIDSLFAALGARIFYGLPFLHADNEFQKNGASIKVNAFASGSRLFSVTYKQRENHGRRELASFLTERYCIWNEHRNRIIKIPIRHKHWKLYEADVSLNENKLFPFEYPVSEDFIAHYSPFQHAMLYPYEST